MNPTEAIIDRFDSITDYLRSREYHSNPKANIFTPLRNVSTCPADNNVLFPNVVNREIAKYLNLKDFAAFSAINVDNYLSLRSDRLLVAEVVENESQARQLAILEDLRQRALDSNGGKPVFRETLEYFFSAYPPIQALHPGPAQLTCNTDAKNFRSERQNTFAFFFLKLCKFATNDSTPALFRASICSLAIDINNTLDQSNDVMAVYYANVFLNVALDVNGRAGIEDKENKLKTLAYRVEEGQLSLRKLEDCYIGGNRPDLGDWGKFLDGLRIQ